MLEKSAANLQVLIRNDAKELSEFGTGKLMVECVKGRTRFYRVDSKNGRRLRESITRKPEEIAMLSRKCYLESELDLLKRNAKVIDEVIAKCKEAYVVPTSENVLARMKGKRTAITYRQSIANYCNGAAGMKEDSAINVELLRFGSPSVAVRAEEIEKLIKKDRYTDDILSWATSRYVKSNYREGELKHRTTHGLWLRSKSEVLIAEKFYGHMIPFRSEEVIATPRGIVVPDFIVPGRDGKLYYWEHAGMMDKEEYREKHRHSLEKYESIGIVPWKNLIVTYDDEDGGIDLERIEMEIKTKLL